MKDRRFWKWMNLAEDDSVRVLELYGTIAEESWFDDDITPKMFHDELFSGSGDIVIWINSPGGDCIAASQIIRCLWITRARSPSRSMALRQAPHP